MVVASTQITRFFYLSEKELKDNSKKVDNSKTVDNSKRFNPEDSLFLKYQHELFSASKHAPREFGS